MTKDEDFAIRRIADSTGPSIVWLRIGNSTNPVLFQWLSPLRRGPLVTAVEPMPDHVLRVCFADGVWTHCDVKPLLHLPLFQPRRDDDLSSRHMSFVVPAVAWNADIDISEYELWQRGVGS